MKIIGILWLLFAWGTKSLKFNEKLDKTTGGFGREDFLDNMFLRLALLPSGANELVQIASKFIQAEAQKIHLPNINLTYAPFNLSFVASNLVMKKFLFEEDTTSGMNPTAIDTANFNFPKLNITITFDYEIKFGINDTTGGNGTFKSVDLESSIKMINLQEEDEKGKRYGRIYLGCEGVDTEFTSLEFNFSNPYTQSEWDIFFDHPKLIKSFANTLIQFAVEQLVKDLDLRLLVNVVLGKGIGMIIGISELVTFPELDLPAPNTRFMDLKSHMILTLQSGNQIEGLFPNKMSSPMLNYNYSSVALNTDVLNKLAQAFFYDNTLNFSINQRVLNLLKFDLLKLETTALKEFFPKIESDFGAGYGCYFQFQTSAYDKYTSYARNTAGQTVLLFQMNLNVFVQKESYDVYMHSSLAACLRNNTCVLAYGLNLNLYLTFPLQISKTKKLMLGFLDLEISKISQFFAAKSSIETEALRQKFNNFIDISLPHLLPEIDLSFLFPKSHPAIDVLDDQRIILSSAKKTSETENKREVIEVSS